MQAMTENRDYYSDNAKFVLIQLVVIGHFTLELFSDPVARGLTNAIYSFHMPVFIFLSGYFSKGAGYHEKDITKILYTYFVFQAVWVIYNITTGLGYFQSNPFIPTHQNWYLLALFTWRLFVPYAAMFNKNIVIAVSVALAFIVGATESFGHFLSLHRTVYFFPIFLLGFYCQDLGKLIDGLRTYQIVGGMCFLIIISAIFLFSYVDKVAAGMIFKGYVPRLAHDMNLQVLLARALGFISSLCIGALFLLLIPKRQLAFLSLGRNSMNAFLLHMFYVFPAVHIVKSTGSVAVAICALAALVLVTTLVSFDRFNAIMKPFTELGSMVSLLSLGRLGEIRGRSK